MNTQNDECERREHRRRHRVHSGQSCACMCTFILGFSPFHRAESYGARNRLFSRYSLVRRGARGIF